MILQFELKTTDLIAFQTEYSRKKIFIFNYKALIIAAIAGILLGFNKTRLFWIKLNGNTIPENDLWIIMLNIIVIITVILFIRYYILLLAKNRLKHARNLEGPRTIISENDSITVKTNYTRLEFKTNDIYKIETFEKYSLMTLCSTEKIIIPVKTPNFQDFMKNLQIG